VKGIVRKSEVKEFSGAEGGIEPLESPVARPEVGLFVLCALGVVHGK
jgi:hypothetical protein